MSGEVPAQPNRDEGSSKSPEGAEISIICDSGLRLTFLRHAAPAAVDCLSALHRQNAGVPAVSQNATPRIAGVPDAGAAAGIHTYLWRCVKL